MKDLNHILLRMSEKLQRSRIESCKAVFDVHILKPQDLVVPVEKYTPPLPSEQNMPPIPEITEDILKIWEAIIASGNLDDLKSMVLAHFAGKCDVPTLVEHVQSEIARLGGEHFVLL